MVRVLHLTWLEPAQGGTEVLGPLEEPSRTCLARLPAPIQQTAELGSCWRAAGPPSPPYPASRPASTLLERDHHWGPFWNLTNRNFIMAGANIYVCVFFKGRRYECMISSLSHMLSNYIASLTHTHTHTHARTHTHTHLTHVMPRCSVDRVTV